MADITVSSAVDTFLQSADQAAMMSNLLARVDFQGSWTQQTYTDQQMVTAGQNGSILAVANTNTTDSPVPLPISDSDFLVADSPSFTNLTAQPYIYTGIRVRNYTGVYEISEIRVWIPDVSSDAMYRLVILNNSDNSIEILDGFNGDHVTAVGWHTIPKYKTLLEGGDYTFYLISSKKSGTTSFNHNWNRLAISNNDVDPTSTNLTNNGLQSKLRISNNDATSTDRASDLALIVPGSVVRVADSTDATSYYEYEVVRSTAQTGWYDYDVVLLSTGSGGAPPASTVTVTATNRTAVAMGYVKITNHFVSSSVYEGYLKVGTGGDAFDDHVYNLDLKVQKYEKSADWDILPGSSGFGITDQNSSALTDSGWAVYYDSTYTSGSPLAVNNAKVQLTNDGAGSSTNTDYLPTSMQNLWASDKVVAQKLGDVYDILIEFKADPSTANDSGDLIIDVGNGSPIVIVDRLINLSKAGVNNVSIAFPVWVLQDFVDNGAKIYFDTSLTGSSIDVYDFIIFIARR